MAERVVLAYSGGQDTSVGIGWPKEAPGREVVALARSLSKSLIEIRSLPSRISAERDLASS